MCYGIIRSLADRTLVYSLFSRPPMCMNSGSLISPQDTPPSVTQHPTSELDRLGDRNYETKFIIISVQVNIPAESGDMGILANHVPSIEQLRPGVIDIIEESGGSKQFFSMSFREYFYTEVIIGLTRR